MLRRVRVDDPGRHFVELALVEDRGVARYAIRQVISRDELECARVDVEDWTWRRMAREMSIRWPKVWLTKVERRRA